MEIHRLKPMKEGYPQDLFNQLYKETKNLRRSLAYQIDARRYGVTNDIILSWFDDKFIFVFNKHFDNKEPDVLKGFLINSLKMFKYRILRKAYNGEGEFYGSCVELEGESNLINIIPDNSFRKTEDIFYNLALEFMKEHLSENAFLLFQIQLDPPPFILDQIKSSNSRIPNHLLAEFLGIDLETENKTERYIKGLKKEINCTVKKAREFFEDKDPLAGYSLI